MKRALSLILMCFLAVVSAVAQQVWPHPVPEEFASDYFEVKVNGKLVPVFHAGLNVYFAGFDFTGSANVEVSSKSGEDKYAGQTSNKEVVSDGKLGYWRGSVQVRPLSRNIATKLEGKTVRFKLDSAGQYSVERKGTAHFKDDVIFIFANRPEVNPPVLTNTDVIHLKPGIHQQHIDLKSGQTLYLEAGAVLFGSINVWDAENVKITGSGTVVYYGPQSEDHDDGWKHQKNWHPMTTHNVKGLTVSGITFVGRSRTWSIQTHTTSDAVFDNIKILAVNPQNINGDGIDWYGGGRARVSNSLIRSMDDCFAFFTEDSSKDMWGESKTTSGEVKDIKIENCVLWTTLANIFRIGFNGQELTTDNIVLKNVDIIHVSKGQWYAPWSLFCMVSPNSKGKARHTNYHAEKLRFEEPIALFGLQNPEAVFSKIVLKDISVNGDAVPSVVNGQISDLEFDNVTSAGRPILRQTDVPLRAGSKPLQNTTFSIAK
ncbi:hypothetical protein LZD49_04465 [Dyadobacter sp. CY261]|uniref:hypothetical protein n=1 Tax=Dyadobacter sp. CY261 TaxID=2907203 RepID=UPI001F37CD29|nr:hypothetical protein [Dyadobacter sp. CY261]MCF0069713.1 hypothetical protein [Dyadobacter sp. CY261]